MSEYLPTNPYEQAPACLCEMQRWQPIETAPKDGTWILGSSPNQKYSQGYALKPESVRWGTYHPNAQGDVQWRALDGSKRPFFTHWMPLPAPPSTEKPE